MNILFFDTETTGVPISYKASYKDIANWPRLVQIGYIAYRDGEEVQSHEFIVVPTGFEISAEVSKVPGITQETALRDGEPLAHVLSEFKSAVLWADMLVGHNLNFDMNVIGCEYVRMGGDSPLIEKKVYDTMLKAAPLLKLPGKYGNYKWPKLQELYQFLFNEPLAQTHTALDDIRQTAKCYFEMQRRGVV